MKLTTFHVFAARLKQLECVATWSSNAIAFSYYDDSWIAESGEPVEDSSLLDTLSHVRGAKLSNYRARKQLLTYFFLQDMDAVVQVSFISSPKQEKQRRFAKELNDCYLNAKNEFDAQHDTLTHLANRAGFDRIVDKALRKLSEVSTEAPSASIESQSKGITLFSFDLDHFKQVNDTYGHLYGDVVLAAFAWRLDAFASDIAKERKISVSAARLGGEEFQLLVEEALEHEDALELANRFRKKITDTPLPSDIEWSKISGRRGLGHDKLPPLVERKITVSIGYTFLPSLTSGAEAGDFTRAASELLSQADTALYRAKGDGRDCARSYREIRDRLGRVLEHHVETGIVTIDIGGDVGVKDGTEFLVFHPQFTGDQPFYYSDGRTRKRLGTYPKVQSGRVIVFSTSREISFCRVKESSHVGAFPSGSRLQYVPLGSITHLFDDATVRSGKGLSEYAKLVEESTRLIASNKKFVAVSFAVSNVDSIVAANGTAAANEVLASVFKAITNALGEESLVSMSVAGEFSIVKEVTESEKEDFQRVLSAVSTRVSPKPLCNIGIFDSRKQEIPKDRPDLPLEYANLARASTKTTAYYDENTPALVIQKWRQEKRWSDAIADYERICALGISSAFMENAAGLCFLEMRPHADLQRAADCFTRAATFDRKQITFQLNLGYALSALGEHQACMEKVAKYLSGDLSEIEPVYLRRFSFSILALPMGAATSISLAAQLAVLKRTRNAQPDLSPEVLSQVLSAIHDIESKMTATV